MNRLFHLEAKLPLTTFVIVRPLANHICVYESFDQSRETTVFAPLSDVVGTFAHQGEEWWSG